MTQVLRGNIIQAPRLGELDIREHGYLVLEDGVATLTEVFRRIDQLDIELVDIDGKHVSVSLLGACKGCPVSNVTLTDFVQQRLQELVEPDITVKEAGK